MLGTLYLTLEHTQQVMRICQLDDTYVVGGGAYRIIYTKD